MLQVSFCKTATNYGALLRKETYKDKVSYASSQPCKRCMNIGSPKKKVIVHGTGRLQMCMNIVGKEKERKKTKGKKKLIVQESGLIADVHECSGRGSMRRV